MSKASLLNLLKQASALVSGHVTPKARRKPATPPILLVFSEQDGMHALPFVLVRDQFRTMRITVRRDGTVLVKIPFYGKDSDALRAIAQKRTWIEAKRNTFRQRPPLPPHHYHNGDVFYYVGRPFTLVLHEIPPKPGTRASKIQAQLQGNNLMVTGVDLCPQRVQKAIAAWRTTMSQTFFAKRVACLHQWSCAILGDNFPLPMWKLRELKRRWASCAAHRSPNLVRYHFSKSRSKADTRISQQLDGFCGTQYEITLARHLSTLPLPCIDYVILHELCHMRHMDHSPRFYALLQRLMPEAPHLSRRLDVWGQEHNKD